MANNPKRIQSLQHAMRVVEVIAASEDGVRLQDLAATVGLTPGAVHHIVDTLVAGGWLARTVQPVRYRLGHALVGLAAQRSGLQMPRVIEAEMLELRRALGPCSISYCEAAGQEILITRSLEVARPDAVVPVTGTVLPPYTSAASVVHLACWPAERAQAYRELRPFEVHGLPLWGSAARFEAALAQVRDQGHVDLPLSDQASLRIGVPVLVAGGALVASLTVSMAACTDPDADRRRVVAAGRQATARIRAQLEGGGDEQHDP